MRDQQDPPLLGAHFNALEGAFPVPLTGEGYAARALVIEHINTGRYRLESSRCLCGGARDRIICKVDRYRIPHSTVLCLDCGLIRTDPRWTEDTYLDFYRNHYRAMYERPGHDARTIFGIQARNASARSAFVRKYLRGGNPASVLEIGCGGGWNLLPFQRSGAAVTGYDFDEEYLHAGRSLGLDVRTGDTDTALAEHKQYDLVILSHVVEHFLQPDDQLRKVRALLNPEGLLFVEVPNLFTVDGNLLRYWQAAHTYSFVPATLRALMERAGYQQVALSREIRSLWRLSDEFDAQWPRDPRLARRIKRFLLSRQRDTKARLVSRELRNRVIRLWQRTR